MSFSLDSSPKSDDISVLDISASAYENTTNAPPIHATTPSSTGSSISFTVEPFDASLHCSNDALLLPSTGKRPPPLGLHAPEPAHQVKSLPASPFCTLSPSGSDTTAVGTFGDAQNEKIGKDWAPRKLSYDSDGIAFSTIKVDIKQQRRLKRFRAVLLHTFLCAAGAVVMYLTTLLHGFNLYHVRLFVAIAAGVISFVIGFSLKGLAKGWIYHAAWSTIIQHSLCADGQQNALTVRDIKGISNDPHGFEAMYKLARLQMRKPRRVFRGHLRRFCISSFSTIVFLGVTILGIALGFALGRIVNITTIDSHQRGHFTETSVAGDLSPEDISAASIQANAFSNFDFTWSLTSFSSTYSNIALPFGEDSIHFSEIPPSTLLPGGSGPGNFAFNYTDSSSDASPLKSQGQQTVSALGSILRFPRWGIRMQCKPLPNPEVNLITVAQSGNSYVFLPQELAVDLFTSLSLVFPDGAISPFDLSKVLAPGDTLPQGLNESAILAGQGFSNNGVAHSLWSVPVGDGSGGGGWLSLETVLVRLNSTFAPHGVFPVMGNAVLDASGNATQIGYDVAVCLEVVEPYLVEVYNATTGQPISLGVVAQIDSANADKTGKRHGQASGSAESSLSSAGKFVAYTVAHQNSVNQILKDNGRDDFYVPNPTLISYTTGSGPFGYTQLSPSLFATTRSEADARNLLPYLTGSGQLQAHTFPDTQTARATVHWPLLAAAMGGTALVGISVWAFAPLLQLPEGVRPRDFGMYSWMAAMQADELRFEDPHWQERLDQSPDIKSAVAGMKVRYVV